MVVAAIIEVHTDGGEEPRGTYEFLELPSPGDVVPLLGPGGMSREFFRVLYVEHNPVAMPREQFYEDAQPWAAVYVQLERREAT